MGANDRGVCIGNTAVWTRLCRPGDHEEKLLGVDLVRSVYVLTLVCAICSLEGDDSSQKY